MQCSICKEISGRKFCQTCGNALEAPVDKALPGVSHLETAHAARAYPKFDYEAALPAFREATKFAASFPRELAMVTWFTYAMTICAVHDGGDTLRKLPTGALDEYVRALKESQAIYDGLQGDSKEALRDGLDYPDMFRSQFSEARRVLAGRSAEPGETATVARPSQPAASQIARQPNRSSVGEANGDNYMLAYPRGAERLEVASTGIRCVKCPNHVIPLSPCPNCGGTLFMLGTDVLNVTGLVCFGCRRGFTSLKCVCGCPNPIQAHTIMRLKAESGGCFIATAAGGDPWAPEVVALSAFRDDFLSRSRIGRAFIRLYNLASPPVAAVIARSSALRRAAMTLVVRPAVWLVGTFFHVNVRGSRHPNGKSL